MVFEHGSQSVLHNSTLHSMSRSITSGNLKAWKYAYAIIDAPVFPVSFVFWNAPNNLGFNIHPISSVSCNVLVEDSSRAIQSRTLKHTDPSVRLRTIKTESVFVRITKAGRYLEIEGGISFYGNDQSHGLSDLNEAIGSRRERSPSHLYIQLSARCVTAERYYFLIQHVHGEVNRQGFIDVSFPEATNSAYRVPNFLYTWFVLNGTKRRKKHRRKRKWHERHRNDDKEASRRFVVARNGSTCKTSTFSKYAWPACPAKSLMNWVPQEFRLNVNEYRVCPEFCATYLQSGFVKNPCKRT